MTRPRKQVDEGWEPKEIKPNEHWVGLSVESVRERADRGHTVFVQTAAGEDINASDQDYESAGATIEPHARYF